MAQGVYNCYFFEKNLQGDIVAIYNASGTKIATYTYDAWGKVTCTTTSSATTLEKNIATTYNPFRYRGYFYDVETGWYYLQSRYYDPNWGRFVNADSLSYLGSNGELTGYNLYAYCAHNPEVVRFKSHLRNQTKPWHYVCQGFFCAFYMELLPEFERIAVQPCKFSKKNKVLFCAFE